MDSLREVRDVPDLRSSDSLPCSFKLSLLRNLGHGHGADGAPVAEQPTLIGSGFGVTRIQLGSGNDGAHVLESDKPVGLQVLGYGDYTSYQYPGGLNLGRIAPVPPK